MNSASNLAMLGRVMGGLVVVLVLIALAARIAKRKGLQTGGTGLRVIDRIGLTREANLTVVEVANRRLLLGVTAQGVTMLADLDQADRPDIDRAAVVAEAGRRTTEFGTPTPAERWGSHEQDAGHVHNVGADHEELHDHPLPVPAGVELDEYPDLASALRAAGRTDGSVPTTSPAATATAPRTRAEARARRTPAAAKEPGLIPRQRGAGPTEPQRSQPEDSGRRNSQDGGDGSEAAGQRAPAPTQASGSVLSPKTWRQGVDALRDLTVRRG